MSPSPEHVERHVRIEDTMRRTRRRFLFLLAAVLLVTGCGSSPDEAADISKRVSARVEDDATCVKAGVQEIAAERTRVYRCTWTFADRITSPCYAMVDGDLLDVTDQSDESFECSHVAALQQSPAPDPS